MHLGNFKASNTSCPCRLTHYIARDYIIDHETYYVLYVCISILIEIHLDLVHTKNQEHEILMIQAYMHNVTQNAAVGVVMINVANKSLMIAGLAKTEVSIGKNETGMILVLIDV